MKLALFFPRNVSLAVWVEQGLLDREELIYKEHLRAKTFKKIFWLTYGKDDLQYRQLVPQGVTIIPMPRFFAFPFGGNLYTFLLPFVQHRVLKKCDVYKTDQMDGCWAAVIAMFLYRKPLLVRTGFPLRIFMRRKGSRFKEIIAVIMERIAYSFCDFAIVSSREAKEFIEREYPLSSEKIQILYNYIDMSLFAPRKSRRTKDVLLFVGRLEPQKNLVNLVKAASILRMGVDIIGSGTLKDRLQALANEYQVKVRFMAQVPNKELPDVYNSYQYFILPSLYEGMPKTLIEAMACGCVCIGTDVMGIREVLKDGINGFLAKGVDADSITASVRSAMQSDKEKIVAEALRTVSESFSLDRFQEKEADIFRRLVKDV